MAQIETLMLNFISGLVIFICEYIIVFRKAAIRFLIFGIYRRIL
jgi:hypothetical protein